MRSGIWAQKPPVTERRRRKSLNEREALAKSVGCIPIQQRIMVGNDAINCKWSSQAVHGTRFTRTCNRHLKPLRTRFQDYFNCFRRPAHSAMPRRVYTRFTGELLHQSQPRARRLLLHLLQNTYQTPQCALYNDADPHRQQPPAPHTTPLDYHFILLFLTRQRPRPQRQQPRQQTIPQLVKLHQ